jgi:hypothetical protein
VEAAWRRDEAGVVMMKMKPSLNLCLVSPKYIVDKEFFMLTASPKETMQKL